MKTKILTIALIISTLSQIFSQELIRHDELGNSINVKSDGINFVPGEVIIKFKDGYLNQSVLGNNTTSSFVASQGRPTSTSPPSANSFYAKFGNNKMRKIVTKYRPSYGRSTSRIGKTVDNFDFQNLMILEKKQKTDIIALCKQLEEYEEIEYAEPNYILYLDDSPANDTQYNLQRGFEQASDADIDADRAWDFTTGNYGVKVAVIDNGVDYHNPDLGNGAFSVLTERKFEEGGTILIMMPTLTILKQLQIVTERRSRD